MDPPIAHLGPPFFAPLPPDPTSLAMQYEQDQSPDLTMGPSTSTPTLTTPLLLKRTSNSSCSNDPSQEKRCRTESSTSDSAGLGDHTEDFLEEFTSEKTESKIKIDNHEFDLPNFKIWRQRDENKTASSIVRALHPGGTWFHNKPIKFLKSKNGVFVPAYPIKAPNKNKFFLISEKDKSSRICLD
eukprot:GHVP01007804.1.p1 GENE.GHVP01007804.1~~GHVP01007804.1.p1  ORF type:complete len:185 (-),score=23.74 GHVP01007804.1:47-601(-)